MPYHNQALGEYAVDLGGSGVPVVQVALSNSELLRSQIICVISVVE